MAVKTTAKKGTDTYFRLVKEYPLAPIRDDADLANAQAVIDRLLERELDRGAQDYLAVLTNLVEAYEDEHVEIPDASGKDVLRELMRANDLSQAKLAKEVGITQSTISDLVNGKRPFTSEHVVALGRFFGVSPAAFLAV